MGLARGGFAVDEYVLDEYVLDEFAPEDALVMRSLAMMGSRGWIEIAHRTL